MTLTDLLGLIGSFVVGWIVFVFPAYFLLGIKSDPLALIGFVGITVGALVYMRWAT